MRSIKLGSSGFVSSLLVLLLIGMPSCASRAPGIGGDDSGDPSADDSSADDSDDEVGGAQADADLALNASSVFDDAVEPKANVRYESGTVIHSPAVGVAFEIPEGWIGAVLDGVFVIENAELGATFFVSAGEGGQAELLAGFKGSIEVDDGVNMSPDGDPSLNEPIFSQNYEVTGTADPYRGYVVGVVGEWGRTLVLLGLGPESAESELIQAMGACARSAGFKDPSVVDEGAAASDDEWQAWLRGKLLHRYYTVSDYSEHQQMWLCPDGQVYRSFNAGGASNGFSAAFQNGSSGTWSATGTGDRGTLQVDYSDSTTSVWGLEWSEGLYLDGTRWYYEDANCDG